MQRLDISSCLWGSQGGTENEADDLLNGGVGVRSKDGRILPRGERLVG